MILIQKRKTKISVEQYVIQENATAGTWGSHQLLLEELKRQDEDWMIEHSIRPTDPEHRNIPAGLRFSKKFIQLTFNTKFLENMQEKHGELHCEYCGKRHLRIYKWNEKQNADIATADHFLPKTDWPDLKFVISNLRVCCRKCNTKKGKKVWPLSAVKFPYPEHDSVIFPSQTSATFHLETKSVSFVSKN